MTFVSSTKLCYVIIIHYYINQFFFVEYSDTDTKIIKENREERLLTLSLKIVTFFFSFFYEKNTNGTIEKN